MVVGVEDPGDVDYENTANLKLGGKVYEGQNVQGDKKAPKRRDIFPGDDVRDRFGGSIPSRGMAKWQGETYPTRLSFRYGKGGRRIPVHEFFLDSKTRKQLRRKHPR